MKKLFIFTIGLITLFVVMSIKGIFVEAKVTTDIIPVCPDDGEEGSGKISSIDIASNKTVPSIKSFAWLSHEKFGAILPVGGSVSYDKEDKITYKSNWTSQEPIYQSFDVAKFETYTFEKYVDLPIKILYSRKVGAGDYVSFKIQVIQSSEESTTKTSTTATTYYWGICNSIGYSMGSTVALDTIEISSNVTSNSIVKVGGNASNTISIVKSSTTKFSIIYEETFTFDNRNSSHDTYFDMNFRQKFQVYFTTKYKYNYITTEWGKWII